MINFKHSFVRAHRTSRRWSILRLVLTLSVFLAPISLWANQGTLYHVRTGTGSKDKSRLAARVAFVCDAVTNDDPQRFDLDAWTFVAGGQQLDAIRRISTATPDDIPLDLFLVLPRDMTMLDAHVSLMRQVEQLPYWLSAMGHRSHRLFLLTYSGCSGGAVGGIGSTRLIVHQVSAQQVAASSSKPAEMGNLVDTVVLDSNLDASPLYQATGTAVCGKFFRGADFNHVLHDLLAQISASPELVAQPRARVMLLLHDGRNVGAAPEAEQYLKSLTDKDKFHRIILIQPDIAPMVWAAGMWQAKAAGPRLMRTAIKNQIRRDLYSDCIDQGWGRTACLSETREQRRDAFASEVLDKVSPRTFSGSIRNREFLTRASLVALLSGSARFGSKKYYGQARRVDQAFKRPRGLDPIGCWLRKHGAGGLEILGGTSNSHLDQCPNQGGPSAPTASSLAEVVERSSPFARALTIDLCLNRDEDGIKGEIPMRLEWSNKVCVEQSQNLENEASPAREHLFESICGSSFQKNDPPKPPDPPDARDNDDWIWTAFGGLALGALLGIAIGQKRRLI